MQRQNTCVSDVVFKPCDFKTLAQSNRQLLDCAFERSRVIELLPQHGSPLAAVHGSLSPLAQKPDPSGPFTPGTDTNTFM